MKERLQLVENNPMVFCLNLQEKVLDGWKIDENEPFNMIFNLYTIGMIKEEVSDEVKAVFPEFDIPEAVKKAGRPKKAV